MAWLKSLVEASESERTKQLKLRGWRCSIGRGYDGFEGLRRMKQRQKLMRGRRRRRSR
jgi:hypothetical protein